MRWFIVHGRAWGDDDDSSLAFQASSEEEAIGMFTEEVVGDKNAPHEVGVENELILINVWDCGEHEPQIC